MGIGLYEIISIVFILVLFWLAFRLVRAHEELAEGVHRLERTLRER